MGVPRGADTVVIGGGTAGAVVAGLLAAQSDQQVLVLEAGPDYGPFADGRWPRGSPRRAGAWLPPRLGVRVRRDVPEPGGQLRAGQSHRGLFGAQRLRSDLGQPARLRHWAAMGLTGWSTEDLLPVFARAVGADARPHLQRRGNHAFPSRLSGGAAAMGVPMADDLNDVDDDEGMATSPVNIDGGVRWNAAFAYLDPVRGRKNLTIQGNCTVDRLIVAGRPRQRRALPWPRRS